MSADLTIAWSNGGSTVTKGGDIDITETVSGKKHTSTLKISNYKAEDQKYTCGVTMSGSTTNNVLNVWQFITYQTDQAVEVGSAKTVLTCKVSGSSAQPTKWTWTPTKTSMYYEVMSLLTATNQSSLFRSCDWLSTNQGPVFSDSVGSCNDKRAVIIS